MRLPDPGHDHQAGGQRLGKGKLPTERDPAGGVVKGGGQLVPLVQDLGQAHVHRAGEGFLAALAEGVQRLPVGRQCRIQLALGALHLAQVIPNAHGEKAREERVGRPPLGEHVCQGREWPRTGAPSRQDSTHVPPSGDAQCQRPPLPSTNEDNTTGTKDSNGCSQARPCTARKLFAAGAIRTAAHGTLCRSSRALAGAGVSASGGPARYEIRVAGVLDSRWAAWFNGLQVSGQGDETVICGLLADQPALHGLLTKVRDLGLCLISVRHVDTGQAGTKHHDQT
jgi:hypothetical protein